MRNNFYNFYIYCYTSFNYTHPRPKATEDDFCGEIIMSGKEDPLCIMGELEFMKKTKRSLKLQKC